MFCSPHAFGGFLGAESTCGPWSAASCSVGMFGTGKQLSPQLLDDTMAAVVTSHLGSSPMGVPDWAHDVMSQQPTEASGAYTQHHHQDVSTSSKSLQQQLQLSQAAQLLAGGNAAPQTDPNAVLYANYRAQHAQAYAAADRLTYGSDVSSAAAIAEAAQQQQHQRQQDMLAAERAFQAAQLAQQQQQQQQLAYEQAQQQQQQQLLLAHAQQQQQQQRQAAATTSALYHASSSQSAMTHQQQQVASSSYSLHQQRQTSLYPAANSMQAPQTTTAARLPPRPSTTHSQHFHPYSSATGAAILEHQAQAAEHSRQQHHNSLVAAAAAARAAATQQQQQQQQRSASASAASTARQTANAAAMAAAAALQRSNNAGSGRWLGAVAVLDHDSQESGGEPCGLECDEDLHSMDCLDHAPHHPNLMHNSAATSGNKTSSLAAAAAATAGQAAAARAQAAAASAAQHKVQLQGARLSGGAAQHAAAVSAAARAAAAGYALNALEDDEQAFDMYEDSGSTNPDSDNQSDDMDADVLLVQDQQHARTSRHSTSSSAPRTSSAGQPGSNSSISIRSAAAAAAAAVAAAEHDAAARQAVAVRVLSSVANKRKGEAVLTVHPAVADAAGAQSVRSRLLITEVSLYCDNAATSMLAMEQSNRLMAKMALPDGITYMPVSTDSFLFKAAHAWQFPAFVICLGSSYLQRMLAKLPSLAAAAAACPGFEDYVRYLPHPPSELPPKVTGEEALSTAATLRSILFTCLFIATKVADQVHALGLLRFILTHLSHNNMVVSLQQAVDVEARCLDALDWRLGPFFVEDELTDDDLELWAAAMGHWDYGTAVDGSMLAY